MEIVILGVVVFLAYKLNVFGGIIDVYNKTMISVVQRKYLEEQTQKGLATGDVGAFLTRLIEQAWEAKPDIFTGKFGQRPHKVSAAAYILAMGAADLQDRGMDKGHALTLALGSILTEIDTNANYYPFKNIDHEIIRASVYIYAALIEDTVPLDIGQHDVERNAY